LSSSQLAKAKLDISKLDNERPVITNALNITHSFKYIDQGKTSLNTII
jgi:hypothetical protein